MPTGSRLVAAILFAGLAFLTSGLVIKLLPEGTKTTMLGPINAIIGLVCGWRIMGKQANDGYRGAIGGGLTTAVAMTVVSVFIFASSEMVKLSLRKTYKGGTEAVVAVFEIMVKYFQMISTTEIVLTLIIGGIICGFMTTWAYRAWG